MLLPLQSLAYELGIQAGVVFATGVALFTQMVPGGALECSMGASSASPAILGTYIALVGLSLLLVTVSVDLLLVYEGQLEERRQFLRTLAALSAEEDCQSLLENLYPQQVKEYRICWC